MEKIAKGIVHLRYIILALAIALLIPAGIGYLNTRVNYDILSYLPSDIETMEGQDILVDEFGTGAYALYIVEGMQPKDIAVLKEKIEAVDHVEKILWYDSFLDLSIPMEMLPDEIYNMFNNADDDATMMFIIFDETTSEDGTLEAVQEIRKISNTQCFLSGMSAITQDTKELTEKETPIYVVIAVLLSTIVLALTMDSFLIPLFFLLNIGLAVVYNMGTNFFLGQISFITQSLSAVLQLGVTMDYSIFLWHSYQEQRSLMPEHKKTAMAKAITATFQSVVGSSITTVAGFIALCFMSFRVGFDIGIVMSKGVILGVISCVTILPSMILIFDNALAKTKHKPLLKEFTRLPNFIAKHYMVFFVLFLCILPFAIYGNNNTGVYYNLSDTLPESLPSVQANQELDENFAMNTTYMLLLDSDMSSKEVNLMTSELKQVDGIDAVLSLDSVTGSAIPAELIPAEAKSALESENHKLMIVTSEYKVASDEVNAQIEEVNRIVKSYDENCMVVGEAPCTKDLITTTNHDFTVVNWLSIGMVFFIIFFVLRSLSLPFVLVAVIEFAIFINMAVPYYMGTTIPFIASIVIGTIQLGSTVDYAILMTTRYCNERKAGQSRKDATKIALSTSMKSIIVSALSFFAATFGVGLISSVDMIGSLCMLMARGALISMVCVICVLPSFYMLFDPIIIRTSIGFKGAREADHLRKEKKKQPAENEAVRPVA